jgi:hypothetical protein
MITSNLTARKFKGFDFLYLVPNFISLHKQTLSRLINFDFGSKDAFRTGSERSILMQTKVLKLGESEKERSRKEDFLKMVTTNSDILYLVVHDECHWAEGDGTIASKFVNSYEILSAKNLVVLQVSATAETASFHQQEAGQSESRIIDWSPKFLRSQVGYLFLSFPFLFLFSFLSSSPVPFLSNNDQTLKDSFYFGMEMYRENYSSNISPKHLVGENPRNVVGQITPAKGLMVMTARFSISLENFLVF